MYLIAGIPMRSILKARAMLLLAVLLLEACAAQSVPTATPLRQTVLHIAVATDDFAVGQPRLPLVLFNGSKRVADAQRIRFMTYDLSSGTATPAGEAANYSDYEVPYWVAYLALPHAGLWSLVAEITLADGSTTQAPFTVNVLEHNRSPAIGSLPPASHNRTLKAEPDIHKLTSAVDPEPGLYQMTVAEAMTSGRPTVVTFATPAYCESRMCAPVVDSVEAVYHTLGDKANFIHIEIYKTFDPLVYADEVKEWGLTSEPWTFVLDKDGMVAARFGGPLSPRELTAALTPLLP